MEINSTDIDLLNNFPLLWRWNQISHTILSDKDLVSIEPLILSKAQELHDFANYLDKAEILRKPETLTTTGSEENVSTWLSNCIHKNERVLVSWNKETGVQMPSTLFIEKWSDFCYPSSDDVFIVPLSGSWILEYRHYEEFSFKEIKAHNQI